MTAAVGGELGRHASPCTIERFPDGEVSVRIEESVRGRDVYFLQPTAPPVDTHLIQLLAFADGARRAGADRITAIVPYFGYARSDRRHGGREPITARLVAELIETAGVTHMVLVDLHALQIEGFFRVPVDTLTMVPTLCRHVAPHLPDNLVVVSPDAGRVPMATEYAQRLGTDVAVLHKQRASGSTTHVTHLVGDVRGRACLLIDDMISTGGTIVESTRALCDAGASDVYVAATHGLFMGDAWDRLMNVGIRRVFTTDTVPQSERGPWFDVVSVAPLLAGAIRRLARDGSLEQLFDGRDR